MDLIAILAQHRPYPEICFINNYSRNLQSRSNYWILASIQVCRLSCCLCDAALDNCSWLIRILLFPDSSTSQTKSNAFVFFFSWTGRRHRGLEQPDVGRHQRRVHWQVSTASDVGGTWRHVRTLERRRRTVSRVGQEGVVDGNGSVGDDAGDESNVCVGCAVGVLVYVVLDVENCRLDGRTRSINARQLTGVVFAKKIPWKSF